MNLKFIGYYGKRFRIHFYVTFFDVVIASIPFTFYA